MITRIASMLPGGVLVGLGIEWWFEATADRYLARAAVLAAVGVILAIRGYRLGVRCDSDTFTVRGIFRSRTIDRSMILDITAFPAVRWTSRSGTTIWTPIIAFAEPGTVIASVANRNEQAIAELERWHGKR